MFKLRNFLIIGLFILLPACGGGDGKPGKPKHTLTIVMDGTGSGRVSSSPTGIICQKDCSESFEDGSEITLTASAYSGSLFTSWEGGACSGSGPCTISLTGDTTLTARFTLEDVQLEEMLTPYVSESDMSDIREGFSTDASAPWGFVHDGIDIWPAENLMPFQSVCAGQVFRILEFDEEVMVIIACNSRFLVSYNFESQEPGAGTIQRDELSITEGQSVARGEFIGNLYAPNDNAHVHFSLFEETIPICPEAHFIPEAKDSLTRLIQVTHGGANLCYGPAAIPHQLLTPYVNERDITEITTGYSSENSLSPWDGGHDGIDIYPQLNLRAFQATCPGVVDTIERLQAGGSSNWQVRVLIRCDDYVMDQNSGGYFIPYYTNYIFETMSADDSDGQAQLGHITVTEGQKVSQGTVIGLLRVASEESHLHFGLLHLGPPGFKVLDISLCPEAHFDTASASSVLGLLQRAWPNANMCYQDL